MNDKQLRHRDPAASLDDHIAALQQDIADADLPGNGRGCAGSTPTCVFAPKARPRSTNAVRRG